MFRIVLCDFVEFCGILWRLQAFHSDNGTFSCVLLLIKKTISFETTQNALVPAIFPIAL